MTFGDIPESCCVVIWWCNQLLRVRWKCDLQAAWWLNQPILKILVLVKMGIFPKVRGENKKYLKLPPSKVESFESWAKWGSGSLTHELILISLMKNTIDLDSLFCWKEIKIPMSCALQHHISASSPGVMANDPNKLIPVSLKYIIAMALPLESLSKESAMKLETVGRHQAPATVYIYI